MPQVDFLKDVMPYSSAFPASPFQAVCLIQIYLIYFYCCIISGFVICLCILLRLAVKFCPLNPEKYKHIQRVLNVSKIFGVAIQILLLTVKVKFWKII